MGFQPPVLTEPSLLNGGSGDLESFSIHASLLPGTLRYSESAYWMQMAGPLFCNRASAIIKLTSYMQFASDQVSSRYLIGASDTWMHQ